MTDDQKRFAVFRKRDAPGLLEAGHMSIEPYTPLQREWVGRAKDAGLLNGDELRVLVDVPGFHLTYAWLKRDYPLPLHSHDSDCLYHIVAGTLRMGSEDLAAGDSFFVPAGVPYTYRPGPEGVEVLEFRTCRQFNMLNLSKGEGFWSAAVETLKHVAPEWRVAKPPSARKSAADSLPCGERAE